jgi:hypothetical protein
MRAALSQKQPAFGNKDEPSPLTLSRFAGEGGSIRESPVIVQYTELTVGRFGDAGTREEELGRDDCRR